MLVSCREMADAEDHLFSTGVEAEPLMEKAGLGCALAIRNFFPRSGQAILFCGKGNNGGDALVAGRWLRKWGWQVSALLSHQPAEMSELARKKLEELSQVPDRAESGGKRLVLVDGLLGIGARGPLRGAIGEAAARMNQMQRENSGTIFAVDIPSGLDGDTGQPYDGAVTADFTLSICAPKKGIAADEAIHHVGRIVEIPLPEIPVEPTETKTQLLFPSNLKHRLPRRGFDFHKGKAGRIVIVAGSKGLTGAPVLTSLGASHSGAGLITVFVPEDIYPIVASQAPVEVMVKPFSTMEEIVDFPADILAVGPGLGSDISDEMLEFIANDPRPMVLDADALNVLAENPDRLNALPPAKRLLTPHPGELARLSDQKGDRVSLTRQLAEKWKVTLLHKGSRTVIATPDETTALNTTGHPGMASGGMGDVLTGVCASLIGQGCSLHDAACLGSWLLGRAAEIAVIDQQVSPISITAPVVADHLGRAIAELSN